MVHLKLAWFLLGTSKTTNTLKDVNNNYSDEVNKETRGNSPCFFTF